MNTRVGYALIIAALNIESGYMEYFVEESQQQDSHTENEAINVATDRTDLVVNSKVVSEEDLNELEERRVIINEDAEKHRKLRDELNNQTKEWKAKRDALNLQVRSLIDEAGKCREERDSLNQKVKETKELRDE